MKRTVRYSGNWTLACEYSYGESSCTLSGLPVTQDQAYALLATRGAVMNAVLNERLTASGIRLTASGIRLTAEEAQAVFNGADPLAVLLPPLWARSLSLEELMSK